MPTETQLQPYITDESHGECWRLLLGDSCERLGELDDSSVDFAIYSPPFESLYTYSPSDRDLGNSASRRQFLDHYRFVIDHMLRVLKPGRTCAVHVQQIAILKSREGYVGLSDFRGEIIAEHIDAGWIYYGEITVDKNPQMQAVRTKAQGLMFVQLRRDAAMSRPALADYVVLFHKPGENATPILPTITNEQWIEWAQPVWRDIPEMATLNPGSGSEDADDRHVCPLQLPLIDRAVRLWSNPGELVLSPFAGIGSEGYQSIVRGRRFVGIELKPSYYETAKRNLVEAERIASAPRLEV